MTPDLKAHFDYATKYKRWKLIQAHPEKALPGEVERLRRDLGL